MAEISLVLLLLHVVLDVNLLGGLLMRELRCRQHKLLRSLLVVLSLLMVVTQVQINGRSTMTRVWRRVNRLATLIYSN